MTRKITLLILSGFLLFNIYGCFALFAGAASGAGTAVWLSGKLTQEFHASYAQTVSAAHSALKSLGLKITKEEREENVTQLRSKYTDGREIWVDVRKVTEDSTKVEVRVGAVSPDKKAADKILKRIQSYL